ncbi:MAG: enoyl-CoA hydratase/isomerase family protein [Proteobacteria bacterium]|nr:enoyl-CoA hydratase/isomerase family protein [Pseudomonadota bacterium]MBI3497931.1 enoyl-CoA hydratase/isomerase family protein [Pseudomonadota bacterium]
MAETCIKTRAEGGVGVITLDRPQALNALNSVLMQEVSVALDGFAGRPDIHAIVIHGAGRAFSAGFDLKESAQRNIQGVEQWRAVIEYDFDFLMQFWDCAKPTIAAVHGFCLAGAFEMALSCDMTVAAEGTRFGQPEVRFGSSIVAMLLPWCVGPKAAKELLLTGNDQIDAGRALQLGIVNHVVPAGQELDKAMQMARDVAAAAPLSVALTKRALNRTYEMMNMRQALLAAVDAGVLIEAGAGPERTEFNRIRKEQGLKAAIEWRDARFRRGP